MSKNFCYISALNSPGGEWGDTINLKKYRPNWEKTIHQLIADNNVNIVFQGHDHIFVRQELDGVVYQTCPMPGDPYYAMVNADAFLTGDKVANSGHVRVAVSSSGIKVDYIRAFLPEDEKDGHKNGETGFSYTLADSGEKKYVVLTDSSPALTIPNGSYIQVIGSKGGNTINVESGANVECLNFPGPNVINIKEASTGFKVYRSGATVYLQSTAGTKIKIPATLTVQTIVFTDITSDLVISNGKLMIDHQEITKTSTSLFSSENNSESFSLTSDVGVEGGTLPVEYSCDGEGNFPALSWSNAPTGTKEFALMMTTLPGDGTTKWSWVLYGIPANTLGLIKNGQGVGTLGGNSHGGDTLTYAPPCSQGPGAKIYTFTLYALSGSPELPDVAEQVTGEVLTKAISSITIGSASLNLNYTRQ